MQVEIDYYHTKDKGYRLLVASFSDEFDSGVKIGFPPTVGPKEIIEGIENTLTGPTSTSLQPNTINHLRKLLVHFNPE